MNDCSRCHGEGIIYHSLPHELFIRLGKACEVAEPHEHKVQFTCPSCVEGGIPSNVALGKVIVAYFEALAGPDADGAKFPLHILGATPIKAAPGRQSQLA